MVGAVLFGAGTGAQRTEDRPAPPRARGRGRLRFSAGPSPGRVRLVSRCVCRRRLVDAALRSQRRATLWSALYRGRAGRCQYSYLRGAAAAVARADAATRAGPGRWRCRPPAARSPWPLLHELRRRGVGVAWLTHAAGLSSTGDAGAGRAAPAAGALRDLRRRRRPRSAGARAGGRVVAVGTTVVRALEGAPRERRACAPGAGAPDCGSDAGLPPAGRRRPAHRRCTSPGRSHFDLLRRSRRRALLERAIATPRRRATLATSSATRP